MTEANEIPVVEDDLNTTAPQSKPEAWKMPEPVFRRTSGKLPQGFEKIAGIPSEQSQQSEISGSSAQPANLTPDPKPRNPILKIIVVVLGLVAMIAFLVVFLTVVYFYFLR